MSLDLRTPVLVGIAAIDQRLDDPTDSLEAFELMAAALEAAADDAGSRRLLVGASSIRVPRGFWQYSDPGRLVAERLGASRARTVLAEIGVLQQTLLSDACRAILAGEEQVALVTGAEVKHRELRGRITGVEVGETSQAGLQPDLKLEPREPLNNYVLQATVRMAEVLRDDPGSAGLVTTISGFMNKVGFGVWSSEPPAEGFRFADPSDEVAARSESRELVGDYHGPARTVGYTVVYLGENPVEGIAVCDLPDGRRSIAASSDPGLAAAMTEEEFCGREVVIRAGGELTVPRDTRA